MRVATCVCLALHHDQADTTKQLQEQLTVQLRLGIFKAAVRGVRSCMTCAEASLGRASPFFAACTPTMQPYPPSLPCPLLTPLLSLSHSSIIALIPPSSLSSCLRPEIVVPLQSDSVEQMDSNAARVVQWVQQHRADNSSGNAR